MVRCSNANDKRCRMPVPRCICEYCVWCEPQVLLAKSQTVRSFLVKGGPNPTWAGPYSSRNPCSNFLFPKREVRSQRRPVTGGGEGARQGQGGRGRVSASRGCQALTHAEALDRRSPRERIRLSPRTRGVIGGVACSQWPMTLTGESPTPFQASLDTPGR